MSRVGIPLALLLTLNAFLFNYYISASEFPERECCDPIYPIPEPTSRAPSAPTPTGRSGSNIKTADSILNCLYARNLCFEDQSCSAILEIIPRVCGGELVACSTVTVTKCQAALRSLQGFPFFRPTCLCREPRVDPECNSFRDFLFDHPCIDVIKNEKDPYPVDALPTCNHALTICQRGKPCIKLFDDFKTNCKARYGVCKMENRDACHDAWTQLRLSPMFGCICPKNHMKNRCDRIFSIVNHNPCVEFQPSSASIDLSGTDSALYPFDPQQETLQEIWLPPTSRYPYYLFPGTARPAYEHRHRHHHGDEDVDNMNNGGRELPELPGSPGILTIEASDAPHDNFQFNSKYHGNKSPVNNHIYTSSSSSSSSVSSSSSSSSSSTRNSSKHVPSTEHMTPGKKHPYESEHDSHYHKMHQNYHEHLSPLPPPPSSSSSSPSLRPTPTTVDESKSNAPSAPKFAPRPTHEHRAFVNRPYDEGFDDEFRIGSLSNNRFFDPRETFEGFVDQVKVISHPDNSTTFEIIESQVENPLIDAGHRDLHALKQLSISVVHRHRDHHKKNHTLEDRDEANSAIPSAAAEADASIPVQPVKIILSSTCQQAFTSCKNDAECDRLLQPVLNHCDLVSCARNECMDALQHFYKAANHKHSMEIAFCLCKKTDGKRDECIVAQEKMHPVCAQRVEGLEMPTCHSLAENCRADEICRAKLQYYEQNCAVDSVTKKCAGPPLECRKAMLGILGTELRFNCACKGTDFSQLYDCLGWQRLLWVNPCVVESQKDFHARRKHHHHQLRTTVTSVSSTTRTITTTATVSEEMEDNFIPEVTKELPPPPPPATEATQTSEMSTSTTTPATTTPSTTTTTTVPPRFCVVQRPSRSHQYIREGKGKRLYREDEPDCSELCQCGEGETLSCNTICVESSPCKTDYAFYDHAAPAIQAYRGRCLCYSGRFICMRPSPGAYSIPHGVFMFLGYSEADETLLRPHNNLTVLDAVSSLDSFMREEVNNQTVCTLFLYNVTRENVIAVARLGTDNPPLNSSQAQSLEYLLRVKEECASMLQDLSDKINNRHQEVHTHPLLSIFKMAEVEVRLPHSNRGTTSKRPSHLLLLTWLLCIFIRSLSQLES